MEVKEWEGGGKRQSREGKRQERVGKRQGD